MIRVDGRARFLDCPALSDDAMKEYVDQIIASQGEPEDRRTQLEHKGAVDVAYSLPGVARFRTNIFHSREKYAIVMRRIVTKIPNFQELNLPPVVEQLAGTGRPATVHRLTGAPNMLKISSFNVASNNLAASRMPSVSAHAFNVP